MERYLDEVIGGFGEIPSSRSRLSLSPAETYLLLAGVLFHDFGRIGPENEHGVVGYKMLQDRYAHLGIPSRELARVLADFCYSHRPPKEEEVPFPVDVGHLGDAVIDPYGPIRCRSLAALIRLVDHMDSAYTRALPPYLTASDGQGVIGLFRSVVRGVHIDQWRAPQNLTQWL